MAKLWAGRTDGNTDKAADEFNSSIGIDGRMFRQDIKGSIAHAAMLGRTGIIAPDETDRIIDGLAGILDDLAINAHSALADILFQFASCADTHVGQILVQSHIAIVTQRPCRVERSGAI